MASFVAATFSALDIEAIQAFVEAAAEELIAKTATLTFADDFAAQFALERLIGNTGTTVTAEGTLTTSLETAEIMTVEEAGPFVRQLFTATLSEHLPALEAHFGVEFTALFAPDVPAAMLAGFVVPFSGIDTTVAIKIAIAKPHVDPRTQVPPPPVTHPPASSTPPPDSEVAKVAAVRDKYVKVATKEIGDVAQPLINAMLNAEFNFAAAWAGAEAAPSHDPSPILSALSLTCCIPCTPHVPACRPARR
jgi:hypothetical protein